MAPPQDPAKCLSHSRCSINDCWLISVHPLCPASAWDRWKWRCCSWCWWWFPLLTHHLFFVLPEPTWNSIQLKKHGRRCWSPAWLRYIPAKIIFLGQEIAFARREVMRKKESDEARQKEKEKELRKGNRSGKRKIRQEGYVLPLSLSGWYRELLERHCFLRRGFCSQSNRCEGLIIILTVCSRKVQTLIYTITLLKYRHLPLFSHI